MKTEAPSEMPEEVSKNETERHLSFKSVDSIRNRAATARKEGSGRALPGILPSEQAELD